MPDAVGGEEDFRGRSVAGFESGEVCVQVRFHVGGGYWRGGGGRTSQRRVENESEQRTSREGSGGDVARTKSALGGGVGDENENGRHRDGLRGDVLDGNARVWRESSRSRDASRHGVEDV